MWWLAHDLTLHTRTHTHMPNRAARRTATTHAHPGLAVHTRDVYSRTCSSYAVRARRAGARRGAPSRTRCGIGSSRPSQKPWAPSPKGRRLASGDERGERFFLVASSKIEAILIQSIFNYDNLTFILQENASRTGAMLPRAARFSARAAGARSARSPGMFQRSSLLACTPAHHPLAIATAHKNLTGSASASATATATAATALSATSAGGAPLLHAVRGMSKKAKKSKGGAPSDDDASADSATAGFLIYIPISPICRTPFSPHFRI